jgi:hypothetical protein
MRGSMQAAMALGIGYALGRKKRLRTATLMAAATAFGSSNVGSLALQRGLKLLSNTDVAGKLAPQFGEISDSVRTDLLDAGKAALGAAVSSQLDSLTSSIHDRAERLRNPGDVVGAGAEEAAEAAGTAGRAASSGARRATTTAGGAARKAAGRGKAAARDDDDRDVDDLDMDDLDDEAEADEYEDNEYESDDYAPTDDHEPDDYPPADDYEPDEEDSGEEDAGEPDSGGARGRRAAPTRRGSGSGMRTGTGTGTGTGQRRSPVSRARR